MHPVTELAHDLFEDPKVIPFQQEVYDHIANGTSVVLQAPTGAGKTFAALAPFVLGQWGRNNGPAARKMIYSLPLRVLAGSLKSQYEEDLPTTVGGAPLRFTTQYGGALDDRFLDGGDEYWMPENNNVVPGTRHAIFTTIDQTLSGYIGTPLSVPYRQSNVLYGSILSGALVFDEFHLLDPQRSFQTALHLLRKSPWPVLVMTATMSRIMRRELCDILNAEPITVDDEDIPHIKSQQDTKKYIHVSNGSLAGKTVVDNLGERTLVICNRVNRAQEIYEEVIAELDERGDLDNYETCLLHSRLLPDDRDEKETQVESWFGKENPTRAIVVATQVVEAGLDISADVMHTEVSPIDSFLQRIGRTARFEEKEATIYVYALPSMEKEGDFLPYDKTSTEVTYCELEDLDGESALTYGDLQPLIDTVLGEPHTRIMESCRKNESELARTIREVRRTTDYSETEALVRHIDNVDIIVANSREVEEGKADPYAYPAISIPVGTFRGFLSDDAYDRSAYVVETFTDEAGQQPDENQYFLLHELKGENLGGWPSRRFVVEPRQASYDATYGLRLLESGTHTFKADEEASTWYDYDYEEEEYKEHIRRLYEQREVRQASLDALKRLSASDRHSEIEINDPECIIDLVIWGHDVAKLANGWQWACDHPDPPLAHGGRIEGRQPDPHAAESTEVVARLFVKLLKEDEDSNLIAQALRAIRTHHGPHTSVLGSFRIDERRQEYLRHVTPELCPNRSDQILDSWDSMCWASPGDEEKKWPDRDAHPSTDKVYALLVYMLRRSDQLATSEVSYKEEITPPSATGVSNFL